MFDMGFSELLLIAVVALVVIGPERLPGAIRTGSVWLGKIKRSYNEIKREVELELHNSEVMENLKKAQADLAQETTRIQSAIEGASEEGTSTRGEATLAPPAAATTATTATEQP